MKVTWKNCLKVCASLFLLFLCIHYWPLVGDFIIAYVGASTPLIIGCAIAYIINIIMVAYEKIYFPKAKNKFVKISRRPVCLTFAFLSLIAIVVIVVALIIPQLVDCVKVIIDIIPKAIKIVLAALEKWDVLPEDIFAYLSSIDWASRIEGLIGTLTSGVGNVLQVVVGAVSSVFSGIVTALISIIFSVYLLLAKDKLKSQFIRVGKKYINEKWLGKITHVLSIMNDAFRRYIIGQCTEAIILGVLCSLGMFIFRLPYATMIGALVAFTALIPVAGAYIGACIGAFMILTVSPIKALIFLVFIIVLQQIEGNVIYPKVVGSSIGLPPIWVLAAVTVGGGMLGVLGMLLGVPIAATLYRLLREDVNNGTFTSEIAAEMKKRKENTDKCMQRAIKIRAKRAKKTAEPKNENHAEAEPKAEPSVPKNENKSE